MIGQLVPAGTMRAKRRLLLFKRIAAVSCRILRFPGTLAFIGKGIGYDRELFLVNGGFFNAVILVDIRVDNLELVIDVFHLPIFIAYDSLASIVEPSIPL